MADDRPSITAEPRTETGSRAMRRLRRQGKVPGVAYTGGGEAKTFTTDAHALAQTLASSPQLLDLQLDGTAVPVIVKERQTDAVRGHDIHLDLYEVNLRQAIQATVPVSLVGIEAAPGVVEGGILEHVTHELNVEALPTDIPEQIEVDVSAMAVGDTLSLEAVSVGAELELLDDLDTTLATLNPPAVEEEPDAAVEEEPALVGDEAGAPEVSEGAPQADAAEAEAAESGDAG